MKIRVPVIFAICFALSARGALAVVVNVPGDCGPAAACTCTNGNTLCGPKVPIQQVIINGGPLTFDCSLYGSFPLGGSNSSDLAPGTIVEITASGITLKNCTVAHGTARGIWAHGANDVAILDNHVFDTAMEPVRAESMGTTGASAGVILKKNVLEKVRNISQGASDNAVLLFGVTGGTELTCNVISSESNGATNNSPSSLTSQCNAFLISSRKFVSTSFSPIAELSEQGTGLHSDGDCVVTIGDATNPLIPTRCGADATWVSHCQEVLANTCLSPLNAYAPFTVPALNFDRPPLDGIFDSVDVDLNGTADLLDEDRDGVVDWRDTDQAGSSAGIADTDVFGIGSTGRNAAAADTQVTNGLFVGVQTGLWAASQGFTNHGVLFENNHVISVGSRPASSSVGLTGVAVLIQGADDVLLRNNTILGTNFGIVTDDASHLILSVKYPLVITGNRVNGSPYWSSELSFGAIQIQHTNALSGSDNRVSGNFIGTSPSFGWKGYGLALLGGTSGAGISVSNNVLSDVAGIAFDIEELTPSDSFHVELMNNSSTLPGGFPTSSEGFYLNFPAASASSLSIHDNDITAHKIFDRDGDNYSSFKVFHNIFRPDVTGAVQNVGGSRPITDITAPGSGNNWTTHCSASIPAVWSGVPAGVLSIVDPNAYEGAIDIERPWDSGIPTGCYLQQPNTFPSASQQVAGATVGSAGDVNRDGIPDVVAGAPRSTSPGFLGLTAETEAGAALIYFGSSDAVQRGQPDIVFTGVSAHDRAGVSVTGGFDFNGDGFPDIVIGAEQVDRATDPQNPAPVGSGRVYLIFFDPTDTGHYPNIADPEVLDTVSLSLVGQPGGIPGVVFQGTALGDQAGFSVAGGGTFQPGGGTDLVIGAPGADPGGRADAGAAYVVFDNAALSGNVPLSLISNGLPSEVPGKAFLGAQPGDHLGFSTAFGGDIIQSRTPGRGSAILGAPGADGRRGAVIVAPGDPDTTPIIVESIGNTDPGLQIVGTQPGEQVGFSVANGKDALADGTLDVLIGAPTYDVGGDADAGRVIATSQVMASGVYSADAVGTTVSGASFTGATTGDQLGYAVAGVGDVTGDGVDDIALGAPFVDPVVDGIPRTDAGAVYLFNGAPVAMLDGPHSVSEIGIVLAGRELTGTDAGEHAGSSIAPTGDVSGDGRDDFAVGAPDKDAGTGSVYVVLRSAPNVGECGPAGCEVADLANGAELDAETGVFASMLSVTVTGILDAQSLPSPVPAGKMLLGAARFAPNGASVLPPYATIHIPTVQAIGALKLPSEVLPLVYHDGAGWVSAGISGTTGANPSYPAQMAVNATVDILRLYAVFVNDADGDGVRDELDNCPANANANQLDTNHDGIGDVCQCLGCDDANLCTADACAPETGCVHINNTVPCSDGNACTVGDACLGGGCQPGALRDADGDGRVDSLCGGADCNDNDALVWSSPIEVASLAVSAAHLSWSNQGALVGPGTTYDVVTGTIAPAGSVSYSASSCLSSGGGAAYDDVRSNPAPGNSYWYLVRAINACATGTYGSAGRDSGIPSCP